MTMYIRAVPYADDELNLPVADVSASLPFYERVFGFRLESTTESPCKKATLERDTIRIGIAENGGDPSQEGCFFEVDNVQLAYEELRENGLKQDSPKYRVDEHGGVRYRVFFVVAPDGLCFCLGERLDS